MTEVKKLYQKEVALSIETMLSTAALGRRALTETARNKREIERYLIIAKK
jgi:hypothetical protein